MTTCKQHHAPQMFFEAVPKANNEVETDRKSELSAGVGATLLYFTENESHIRCKLYYFIANFAFFSTDCVELSQ